MESEQTSPGPEPIMIGQLRRLIADLPDEARILPSIINDPDGVKDITIENVRVLTVSTGGERFLNVELYVDDGDDDLEYVPREECVAYGDHLTSVDEDGYCNYCGEQE